MKISKNGLERKLKYIEELQERINEKRLNTGEFSTKGVHDGSIDDPSQIYYMNEITLMEAMLRKAKMEIAEAEIVEEENFGENAVELGDIVELKMTYSDGEELEIDILLSDIAECNDDMLSISFNSPVGAAIYGKNIGSVVQCETPQGPAVIQIVNKRKAHTR